MREIPKNTIGGRKLWGSFSRNLEKVLKQVACFAAWPASGLRTRFRI